jgi:ubiquinone/menaquinone biosynthesis C-methylase UbiE
VTEVGQLDEVYAQRFDDEDADRKNELWRVICAHLQRYVRRDGAVLDLACDRGDFIRNIDARERWACDMRDVARYLPEPISFVQTDGLAIAETLPSGHFDLVFMSNYLEHLQSGEHVVAQLRAVARVLKPGGRTMVLQPNIRLTGPAYWDFVDHKVALTEKSLVEAAELAGFRTEVLITRFLPYTTKGRLPVSSALARIYLRLPPAWLVFGKQTLYVGSHE